MNKPPQIYFRKVFAHIPNRSCRLYLVDTDEQEHPVHIASIPVLPADQERLELTVQELAELCAALCPPSFFE